MYSGDKCETESNELKTIKEIISISNILAIIIIISFFILIALMDSTKYLCNKKSFIPRRKTKPVIEKCIYVNKSIE